MTDTAGPFDGTPWAEAQWARHAAAWAPSGVYGAPAASTTTGDLPLSMSALTVGLGAGRAWVRGFGFERTGAAVMQAVTANTHASFSRRDRIVLRRNLATHTVSPVLLTGTPAGTPAAPALTQSETGSWDLPQYSFLVPPNSGTSLTGIVDERGWLSNGRGLLAFAGTAARDANFPSPAVNDACLVGGRLQVHDGASWQAVPKVAGATTALTLNANGDVVIPHGLGATPDTFSLDLVGNSGAAQFGKPHQYQAQDATNLYVRVTDTRNGTALSNFGVTLAWSATVL